MDIHQPMRFAIRTDAAPMIGGGHVMRCLALAEGLRGRGHDVVFLTADRPGNLAERIREANFPIEFLPCTPQTSLSDEDPPHAHWLPGPWQEDAQAVCTRLNSAPPDWLIVDHYGLDARWAATVRRSLSGVRIFAIDDLDDRALGADLLLDQTSLTRRARCFPTPTTLLGPDYALLRSEFSARRAEALARRNGSIRRVLIAPGMGDAVGLAPLALRALLPIEEIELEVVMGSDSPSVNTVRQLLKQRPEWLLHLDSSDMATYITKADLCIGAGGMSSWERCTLGLPTLLVPVAENQMEVARQLARVGAAEVVSLEDAPQKLAEAVRALQRDPHRVREMAQNAARLSDGKGLHRCLDILEARLRPISLEDAKQLFVWRNAPHIRVMSRNQAPLTWEEHLEWLRGTLIRRDGQWLIYSEGNMDLGHVYVQRDVDVWSWGFYIGARHAPKGAGGRMLSMFLRDYACDNQIEVITAEIRTENSVSIALHERLGFVHIPDAGTSIDGTILHYRLCIEEYRRRWGLGS